MSYLRASLPILLLVLAALAAYANAGSDALVLDDKLFAGHERFADLARLPEYFRESVWSSGGAIEPLYRPLLMVTVALNAALFGEWIEAWHWVNVGLHATVAVLVYLLLLQLLQRTAPRADDDSLEPLFVALMAALVWAVHPVHTEVVNSIFNRSSLLSAIACVGGLWWLLRWRDSRPVLAWTGIWLAYWLALFSRETGAVLPALAAGLVWIYSDGTPLTKLKRCAPVLLMLVPLVVYLVLRAKAIAPPPPEELAGLRELAGAGEPGALVGLPEWRAVLAAAGAWLDGLRLSLWPHPLLISHARPSGVLQAVGLGMHLVLVAAALYLYSRKRPGLLAGLLIFYVALLPSSRLVGSDGMLPYISERYLYLPSVGLTVLLALGLRLLYRRGDRLLAAAPVVLALLLLTPLTWARNASWSSETALLEADYRNGARGPTLLRLLTGAQLLQGNNARVVELCRAHPDLVAKKAFGHMAVHCGTAWALSGDSQRAEEAFRAATRDPGTRTRAHSNLARLFVTQGRAEEARAHFEQAIASEEDPATRAYREGLMRVQLYPDDRARLLEARDWFEEALRLQPRHLLATGALQRLQQRLAEPAPDGES